MMKKSKELQELEELDEIKLERQAERQEMLEQEAKLNLYLKGLGKEKICYRCNKKFRLTTTAALYVYKTKDKNRQRYFCGWTCLSLFKKERDANDARKKKGYFYRTPRNR